MRWDFVECVTCAAKTGTPTLCASCVHNRDVISRYAAICDAAIKVVKEWLLTAKHAQTETMAKLAKLLSVRIS